MQIDDHAHLFTLRKLVYVSGCRLPNILIVLKRITFLRTFQSSASGAMTYQGFRKQREIWDHRHKRNVHHLSQPCVDQLAIKQLLR